MHPKFDPTGVRTHDLQIITVHFMSLRCLFQPLISDLLQLCARILLGIVYFVKKEFEERMH